MKTILPNNVSVSAQYYLTLQRYFLPVKFIAQNPEKNNTGKIIKFLLTITSSWLFQSYPRRLLCFLCPTEINEQKKESFCLFISVITTLKKKSFICGFNFACGNFFLVYTEQDIDS